MFCENCGATLPAGQSVCPNCNFQNPSNSAMNAGAQPGAPMNAAAYQAAPQPAATTPVTPQPAAPAAAAPQPAAPAPANNSARNKKIIIAAIIVGVIAIIALAVFLVFQHNADVRKPHPVKFQLNVPEWQAGDTYIPAQIKGYDIDDEVVDEVQFVDPRNPQVKLRKGAYTVSFPASPLTVDGILYSNPCTTFDIEIPEEDMETAEELDIRDEVTITFKKLTAFDESDEQIENAYTYAALDTESTLDIDTLRAKAYQVHNDALAQKEAVDQKTREEAARQARITRISGTVGGSGNGAPGSPYAIGSMTMTDDELIVKGDLYLEGSSGYTSLGNKTWTFELNNRTEYGWGDEEYHTISKSEFQRRFGNNNFVGIRIELNNGVVTRVYSSS